MKLQHILLVDDSRATNFIHEIVIRETGLVEVISVVENGLEALNYLQVFLKYYNPNTKRKETNYIYH